MQGITSHAFAAVMTFTVLTFPTPSDLVDAFQGRPHHVEKTIEIGQFPTLVAYEPPVNNMLAPDDLFPVVSACIIPGSERPVAASPDCQTALDRLADATGVPQTVDRIAYDAEALILASTYFCRAQWAEAMRVGETFDPTGCILAHRVVENTND